MKYILSGKYLISPKVHLYTIHPHARGEHLQSGLPMLIDFGSSPRMWGTLLTVHHSYMHSRFIPTLAGNTIWPA